MKKKLIFTCTILLFISCSNNDSSNNNNPDSGNSNTTNPFPEWLIPINEVRDGGPGIDGIPSIDNPVFLDANDINASYLEDEDLIIGVVKGNTIKAYPHIVMDWHEITNDNIGGFPIIINYCPLTGTAFAWEGFLNNQNKTFGVSGLLYNTNLILYDRETGSKWSQLRLQCVNGPLIGEEPKTISVIETKWGIWKSMFPSTKVLSLFTGFNRDYSTYPYGDYRTNNNFFLFNVNPTNNELPSKERVFAVIDNNISKVYRFNDFVGGKIIKETFNGENYLIVGNYHVINAFKLNGVYSNLDYEYIYSDSEEFFIDNEGNKWNIFGKAITGSRIGERLNPSISVVSYWFAIAAFYPNPAIYSE
jgi:Protein of unknown function (DUF3179)